MENNFGITQEDIDGFTPEDEESEEPFQLKMEQLGQELTGMLDNPRWIAQAKMIARLPGLSEPVKLACIFLGPGATLSQLLLLHLPARGTIKLKQGLTGFQTYCELLGIPAHRIAEWVAFYFTMGVLEQLPSEEDSTMEPTVMDKTTMAQGPLAPMLSSLNYDTTTFLWNSLLHFKESLIERGVEFVQDKSMRIINIDDLAPDK